MNTTLKRLMKEAQELSGASSSPSPYFHAHPVSDSNFFDWHFTLAGPPAPSPYAGGIYHGRIILPPQYPLRPPSFRFLTPSGRFEVNREICLSISGHHEETWQPAWGIRTALTAIRSFMEMDANGQVGGIDAKEEVRREWARRSRGWRCEGCAGGKTNEDILREWWDTCRAKGVEVDEHGEVVPGSGGKADEVPKELKLGYKDELKNKEAEQEKRKEMAPAMEEEAVDSTQSRISQSGDPPRLDAALSSRLSSSQARLTEAYRDLEEVTGRSTTSTSTAVSRPPTTLHDAPIAASTTATPSTVHTPQASSGSFQQRNAPVQVQAAGSAESHWLDRAIIAVVFALVVMVMKKLFADDPL